MGCFVVTAAALLALAGLASAGQADASIRVGPDGDPASDEAWVELVDHEPGTAYAWRLDVPQETVLVDVEIEDTSRVDRARQWVPQVDGSHFVEEDELAREDATPPAFNLSTRDDAFLYTLAVPGPGEANLTLERDTSPPNVTLDPVRNVTHYGFTVTTHTGDPARGEIVLEDEDGEVVRTHTTPSPGVFQRFPVIGLDAETTYAFHVRVWDWSDNEATTETQQATTLEEPNPPGPTIEEVSPPPGATVNASEEIVVEVAYSASGSPVNPSGINLFFDKEPVHASQMEIHPDRLRYTVPAPHEPRTVSISVEVPTQAGGTSTERWSIHVEEDDPAQAPLPGALVAGAIVLGALALRRWR